MSQHHFPFHGVWTSLFCQWPHSTPHGGGCKKIGKLQEGRKTRVMGRRRMWPKRRSLIQSENVETLYPKARRLEGISRPRSNSRTKDIEAEMDVSLSLFLFVDTVGFATGCGMHVCRGAEEHAVVEEGWGTNQRSLLNKVRKEEGKEGQTKCKERPKDS